MAGDRCAEHGEAIARLETRMDAVEHEISGKLDKITDLVTATNGRLRKVELWRAWVTGGVVVTLAALSAAATVAAMIP